MGMIFGLLGTIVGLANLVCFIMVVIKLFQAKGVGHGILGIICGLYTFIWGWQNVEKNQNRNVMMAWTGCILLSIVFNIGAQVMARSG
jgi:hypothetical protein